MGWLRVLLSTNRGLRRQQQSSFLRPSCSVPAKDAIARLFSASSRCAPVQQRFQPPLDSANLQAFCTNEAQGLTKAISKKLRKPQGGTKGSASRIKSRDWRHGISPKAVDLVEQIMRSRDEKEAVWKELDMWVESEREFSIAYVKQALQAFKQEKHWSRVIQVSEWMLKRGEGKTLRTYEVLLHALDMQKYVTEAERVWKNDILKSSWSIPGRLVSYALDMFERHHKPREVIKLFTDMERSGRKFDKPSILTVSRAYEQEGFLAMKEEILVKYNLSLHGIKALEKS